MSETTAPTQRRAGERSARRALRRAPNSEMLPGLTNTLPVCDVMDSAQVEHIDVASMDILETWAVCFATTSHWQTGKRRG